MFVQGINFYKIIKKRCFLQGRKTKPMCWNHPLVFTNGDFSFLENN